MTLKFGDTEKKVLICIGLYKDGMKNLAELTIKDFRAIKSANIGLNGITVVSGINGCGKSTMSKLLYYVFRNANQYSELVLAYTNSQIRPYLSILEQIQSLLIHKDTRMSFRRFYRNMELTDLNEAQRYLDSIKEICNRFVELDNTLQKSGDTVVTDRLRRILHSTLKTNEKKDIKHLMDVLTGRIAEHFDKAEQLLAERPYRLLRNSLNAAFDYDLTKKITIKEYGDTIYGDSISNVPVLHYIQKVAYIDTPMVIGMDTFYGQPLYWKELNSLLKLPPKRGYKRTINTFIKETILNGDVSYDDDFSGTFKYKRKDGLEFDLLECATGIKSFSLMQLLLKNLFLDENTLMIIDEPEAHLHPQWIVEYARLIVWLHKKIGVKFFIASHSTDMVSAIRYIAEKEKSLSTLSFYVAENATGETFTFRYLEHDIEPIFESFNKSFERLDFYVNKK